MTRAEWSLHQPTCASASLRVQPSMSGIGSAHASSDRRATAAAIGSWVALDLGEEGLLVHLSLDGEQVDQADVGVLGEQLRAGAGERGRDLAGQVRLARRLVLERVEDPEGDGVDLEAVPDPGARLLLDDRPTAPSRRPRPPPPCPASPRPKPRSQGERHVVLLVRACGSVPGP